MRRRDVAGLLGSSALLHACGGSGGGQKEDGPGQLVVTLTGEKARQVAVSDWFEVTRFDFRSPGRYTLVATALFTAGQVIAPSYFNLLFDLSGQGQSTGDGSPAFPISKAGQVVSINNSLVVEEVDPGPWQARIIFRFYGFGGVLTDPVLKVYKR